LAAVSAAVLTLAATGVARGEGTIRIGFIGPLSGGKAIREIAYDGVLGTPSLDAQVQTQLSVQIEIKEVKDGQWMTRQTHGNRAGCEDAPGLSHLRGQRMSQRLTTGSPREGRCCDIFAPWPAESVAG
jgi:hypothetical protein